MKPLFCALLLALPARAYEVHQAPDGQPFRWRFDNGKPLDLVLIDPPFSLRLRAGSDLRRAMAGAAEQWQAAETAQVRARFAGQSHLRAAAPGEVLVSFDTDTTFPGGRDAAGFTELTTSGHDIVSARVHLNARDFDWATDGLDRALDVQSVTAHELGHALGLAHPCGDLDTQRPSCSALPPVLVSQLSADVMYPSIQPGARRTLSDDDRAGISALHPAPQENGAAVPLPAPRLTQLLPDCLEPVSLGPGLPENVTVAATGAANPVLLELLRGDAVIAQAAFGRDEAGALVALVPAAALHDAGVLDARLNLRSGKTSELFNALTVRTGCQTRGCSSAGGSLSALLPVLLLCLRRRRAALVPLGALLLCALPAHAYKRSINKGELCLWWSTRGHSFQIDARGTPDVVGSGAFSAIRKSFATWGGVSCSDLAFTDLGLSQDPKDRRVGYFAGEYNRNLVLFRTVNCHGGAVPANDPCLTAGGCGNQYDCWDHADGVIATTTTTSNRFTGQITDSDIEINDAPAPDGTRFVFTAGDGPPCGNPNQTGCVRIDIQNTVTHEAGHSIGLDHTTDPTATMYATAPEGETSKRSLHSDDIQAICDIYPREARTVTCLSDPITLTQSGTSNGGGCGCSQTQAGPGAAFGLLACGLLLRRAARRRRRSPAPPPAPPRAG